MEFDAYPEECMPIIDFLNAKEDDYISNACTPGYQIEILSISTIFRLAAGALAKPSL
jgi:hypothetical protein